jgi:hypothetical protein
MHSLQRTSRLVYYQYGTLRMSLLYRNEFQVMTLLVWGSWELVNYQNDGMTFQSNTINLT